MNALVNLKYLHFLEQLLKPYGTSALVLADGRPLHITYEHLSDIGTLPRACQTTLQYLQLKDGEIALLSDPYSGGTICSTLTFLIGVDLKKTSSKKGSADILAAVRISLRPSLKFTKTIEEEGLRIPPTPIGNETELNQQVLDAISAHPLCPDDFSKGVLKGVESVRKLRQELKDQILIWDLDFKPQAITQYFQSSFQMLKQLFSHMPLGEVKIESRFDRNERLKLALELDHEKLHLDFHDTSNSQVLHLTDTATFGACFGAMIAMTEYNVPANAGTFRFLEVRSPSGSMLNSSYPSPTFLGMSDGIALVANSLLRAFGKLYTQKEMAMSGVSECSIDLFFQSGVHFFDSLPGGTGATRTKSGVDGLFMWKRSKLQPSVEEIEKRFPMSIMTISPRMASGGTGILPGGDGITKSYRLHEPAKLKWFLEQHVHKPEGFDGGFHGHETQIQIHHASGKKEKLTSSGELNLQAEDTLILMSAGGGAFGRSRENT